MKKIVISIQNGLLAEAITEMVSYSGEFQPFRIKTGNKKNDVVDSCEMFSADMLLAEVAYSGGTTIEARLREVKELRKRMPECKLVLLCEENATPDVISEVIRAKQEGLIDNFFYSSVTAKYLLAALVSM